MMFHQLFLEYCISKKKKRRVFTSKLFIINSTETANIRKSMLVKRSATSELYRKRNSYSTQTNSSGLGHIFHLCCPRFREEWANFYKTDTSLIFHLTCIRSHTHTYTYTHRCQSNRSVGLEFVGQKERWLLERKRVNTSGWTSVTGSLKTMKLGGEMMEGGGVLVSRQACFLKVVKARSEVSSQGERRDLLSVFTGRG